MFATNLSQKKVTKDGQLSLYQLKNPFSSSISFQIKYFSLSIISVSCMSADSPTHCAETNHKWKQANSPTKQLATSGKLLIS